MLAKGQGEQSKNPQRRLQNGSPEVPANPPSPGEAPSAPATQEPCASPAAKAKQSTEPLEAVIGSGQAPPAKPHLVPGVSSDAETYDTFKWRDLVKSYLEQRRLDEAERLLLSVIRDNPENAEAHDELGTVYWSSDRLEQAVEEFAEAEHLSPQGGISDGLDQIVQGPLKGDRGIQVLLRMIAKYPEDHGLKYSLAWAYRLDDQLSEAAHCFQLLLSLDLRNEEWMATIELELSAVLEELGELEEAVALVEKALPRLGNEWSREEIEQGLFDDYLDLGRFEDALKLCLNMLRDATPSVGLSGDIHALHSRRDSHIYERAKKNLSKILDAAEDADGTSQTLLGKAYLALSRCCEELGDPAGAERAREEAEIRYNRSND